MFFHFCVLYFVVLVLLIMVVASAMKGLVVKSVRLQRREGGEAKQDGWCNAMRREREDG